MVLSAGNSFKPREAEKIKERIKQAKNILDEQVQLVLDKYANGINQYRNLDILNTEYDYGEKPKVTEPEKEVK